MKKKPRSAPVRPVRRKPGTDAGDVSSLFLIVHNAALTVEIKDALAGVGIAAYTVVEGVHGQGRTGKRFGDEVFPGINHLLLVAVSSGRMEPLRSRLAQIAERNAGVGLKIFALPARDLL